jgi:hypothetical protein
MIRAASEPLELCSIPIRHLIYKLVKALLIEHPALPPPRGRVRVGGQISLSVNSYNARQKIIFGHAGLQNMQFLEPIFYTC